MATLENFKNRHAELESMVSDLRKMMTPEQLSIRPNAMTAHRMLCDLAGKVKELLSEQDKTIYPDLLTHEDPQVKSIAWGFINGQIPLRKSIPESKRLPQNIHMSALPLRSSLQRSRQFTWSTVTASMLRRAAPNSCLSWSSSPETAIRKLNPLRLWGGDEWQTSISRRR